MVLLASSFDQSRFMSAADFPQEKKLRIKSVTVESVRGNSGQEQKPVAWFTNHKKGLVLNATNRRTLQAAFGDDMELWADAIIVVFPTQTDFGGKLVGALRIRIPPPKQATAGNGQPAEVKATLDKFAAPPEPKPEPKPGLKPALKDDLDDEIGF
jgi:hypothetical protein